MNSFFRKIKTVFTDKSLRNRVLFVVFVLVIFRFLGTIPVPGVNTTQLSEFLANNQLLSLFSTLTGGGLSSFSIVMLGVSPYITASIIMQVMGMMVPSLKELMQESGEIGRKKFNQYTRLLSVPISLVQSFAFLKFLQAQGAIAGLSISAMIVNVLIITAGSVLLMWLGELINEYGIGNGVSLIIMGGIIASLPTSISQFLFTFTVDQLPMALAYFAIGLVVIAGVVYIYEAERPVGVTYARQVRGIRQLGGSDTYIPLRLTQAGVMPIIFASSMLVFPQFLVTILQNSTSPTILNIAQAVGSFLQNQWAYGIVYFALVVFFTYFYTAITFDPKQIATNLQKNGAFVPGVRPGDPTRMFLANVVTRITLVGSLFLGIVAVLPIIVQNLTGITAFAVGGTSLLITVSVVIDLIRRIDAQVSMQEY